ncbi:MAG: hypothetical protein R3C97_17460 [Geminicoccaceae bacterium]
MSQAKAIRRSSSISRAIRTRNAILPGPTPRAEELARQIGTLFDLPAVNSQVLASQRKRRAVERALRQGVFTPWDFQPFVDETKRFMRNHLDLNEVEERSRHPRPKTVRRK